MSKVKPTSQKSKSKKLEVGDRRWENKIKKLLNLTSHFPFPTSYF